MSNEDLIYEKFFAKSKEKGFITEDDLLDSFDEFDVPLNQIDYITNKLLSSGVLIVDTPKENTNEQSNDTQETIIDYSQTDYSIIYDYFCDNYISMKPTIDYIKALPPIQKGEIRELLRHARSGNESARQLAITKNLRLALKSAYLYKDKTSISLEDIFDVAVEGLIISVDNFDASVHLHFSQYASLWMKQRVDRYIIDTERMVRLPVHFYERVRSLIGISSEFSLDDYSLNEQFKFIRENSDLDTDEIMTFLTCQNIECAISLEDYLEFDNDIEDTMSISPDEIVCISDLSYMIDKALSELTQRECRVIKLRYGLEDGRVYTLEEIGSIMCVTKERIRQIETKAIGKLRKPPRIKILSAYSTTIPEGDKFEF